MQLQKQSSYIKAASAVKTILEDETIKDYPIPIRDIINRDKNVTLITLREFAKMTNISLRDAAIAGGSGEAFHFSKGKQFFIVYNDEIYRKRMRFTLAHEYGHFKLGHKGVSLYDKNSMQEVQEEYEANVFASCLLFPLHIRYRLKSEERTEDIVKTLDISHKAAEVAMNELHLHLQNGLENYISTYKHLQLASYIAFLKDKYQGRLEYYCHY
ncbi:ImmA/IrrE family metallo-endopeptidase [Mammaliicoccus sciuri]|uniref:ImmA/IrrE family metallo-endopeptidase n=1 Tax=Mammaliicoccus sciuri TaxID=1296 RepID=UPI0034DD44E0